MTSKRCQRTQLLTKNGNQSCRPQIYVRTLIENGIMVDLGFEAVWLAFKYKAIVKA